MKLFSITIIFIIHYYSKDFFILRYLLVDSKWKLIPNFTYLVCINKLNRCKKPQSQQYDEYIH
jgi:hypothetical protein